MKHLSLKILPFAILSMSCDRGNNDSEEEIENDSIQTHPQVKKGGGEIKNPESAKPEKEKTADKIAEELAPILKTVKAIDFGRFAQKVTDSGSLSVGSLSTEELEALESLDKYIEENCEAIRLNYGDLVGAKRGLYTGDFCDVFWKGAGDGLNTCLALGKFRNIIRLLMINCGSWFSGFGQWEKTSGFYLLKNWDLEGIKFFYEESKKYPYLSIFPRKNEKNQWGNLMCEVWRDYDFEMGKFFFDLYPELLIDETDFLAELRWLKSEIPFEDKDNFCLLDFFLCVSDNEQKREYLLEKYPDYKISAGVLYFYLSLKPKHSSLFLEKFDEWEQFIIKCGSKKEECKAIFNYLVSVDASSNDGRLNFKHLIQAAEKKGVDLFKIALSLDLFEDFF